MSKRVAILQPNYIPWKGYFDMIHMVDEFVVYDEVQYTKNDWRNRNVIKTPQGPRWLTIPVRTERLGQSIIETRTAGGRWRREHWATLCMNYARAGYFTRYAPALEALYLGHATDSLRDILVDFIVAVNAWLGIGTRLTLSSSIPRATEGRIERLREILLHTEAGVLVNGPAARAYMPDDAFAREEIVIEWMSYEGYPEYRQLYPPFEHRVSILDLLFNEGPEATRYMKSWQRAACLPAAP